MNSHIVEKTMHSIKNIDRLTDLAAIDVYNTTHDTINKYEIMKEHATEEYTNESFYQESVLAGVLIGAGVLGVAVSAFFIIKKIIDSKSKVTTKNSNGSTSVAVDLSDPKSTEKFIAKLKERASKLKADTKVTTSQSIDPKAAEEEINLLEVVVESFQNIIDSKDDTAKIKEILKGLKTDTNFDELTNKAFVSGDKEITLGNYIEELGIGEMVNFSKKINELKTKCDKAEKTINGMKANNENNSSTEGITDVEIKTLKDFSTKVAKALDSMLNKSNAICSSANTILDQAEEDAKKPKEEAKPETSEAEKKDKSTEKPADTGAAENKTEVATGENKTGEQSAVDTGSGAGGNDNTGKKSSTLENVMGSDGQTEAVKQASEARKAAEAAEAQNQNVLYLNPNGNAQDATGKQIIPAAAEAKANEKTLEDVTNMLKGGKSEEEIKGQLTLNNYKADQIDAFLTEAKNKIANERKSELLNQTLGGTKPKVLEGEVLPPDTEAKPFKFPKAEDNTFNNNRQKQGIDKVVENIRRLVPADSKEGSWDKIVPTLKTYGFTDDEINDYAARNNMIPSESQGTPAPTPTETTEPKTEPSTPADQNAGENAQETTPENSETKPEGENSPAAEGSENTTEDTNGIPYNVLSAEYLQSLLNMPEQSAIEAIKKIKDEDIEKMAIGIPKNIFVQLFENAASALATVSPTTYLQQLTDMLNNNAAVNKIKALLYQIKQGDRTAFPKLKTTNFKELAELTDGRDVSDYITSILPRVKSAFDSLVNKYKPEMLKGVSQIETRVLNIEQNVVTFFNFIKDACKGLVNKDKALDKVNDMESLIGQLLGKLDPNFSYGDAYSRNEFGNNTENTPDPFPRQRRQGTMTAPTPLNPSAPQEWNDNMNALKSAGAENISQKTEVPPISPIDTNADIAKAKAEKAQLDALQQHRQEQLAQLKAERAQREQQVRNAYAQDAQARQNAVNEELAKQSQEDEQKKAQAEELTKANEDANVAEAIRQAEEEKKALEEGKNLSVSPQSTEGLDNAAKMVAMQDFIKNFKDPAWREAHPGVVTWQDLYNSDGYKNEAIMKVEADRIKNEKLADNRAGIQFIKEQNYEAIVPSLNKVLDTTPDFKTIGRYLDGLKTAYAKILMQYQQNPGNARKIIEDYSKNGAAPYEFYTVPYNELNQTQLIDWQQRLFGAKVELDKDRRRNRKKIKAVDKIIDKLIELDELLKTSVHNVIAAATKNPMRALEAALVMFQEGDEEIIAGLTAIENFINKADEVKASEEEADKTPENPAEEPSDEEVSQSILSILKS